MIDVDEAMREFDRRQRKEIEDEAAELRNHVENMRQWRLAERSAIEGGGSDAGHGEAIREASIQSEQYAKKIVKIVSKRLRG